MTIICQSRSALFTLEALDVEYLSLDVSRGECDEVLSAIEQKQIEPFSFPFEDYAEMMVQTLCLYAFLYMF